jgi:DNA primase
MRISYDRPKSSVRKPCGTPEINREWVAAQFGKVTRGSEVDVCCPIHGESNASLRINVDKGVFFCHGCGEKGALTKLAKAMKVPYAGSTDSGTDIAMLYAKLDKLTHGRRDNQVQKFMDEDTLKRYEFPTDYWAERGLTKDTEIAFDLGYDVMANAATIPVRDPEGKLIGVTRRFLDNDADSKYKDPKGFVKGENLFASWFVALDSTPYAVLTEGPMDAMKVWQSGHPAMAQYGSHVSAHQIRLMRQMGIVTLILFYDNDKAGRKCQLEALGITTELRGSKRIQVYNPEHDLSRFFILKAVRYSSEAKDPGELADKTIDAMVRSAEFYQGTST